MHPETRARVPGFSLHWHFWVYDRDFFRFFIYLAIDCNYGFYRAGAVSRQYNEDHLFFDHPVEPMIYLVGEIIIPAGHGAPIRVRSIFFILHFYPDIVNTAFMQEKNGKIVIDNEIAVRS
jgi:hypothetical protein